jgi:hypothetical protein
LTDRDWAVLALALALLALIVGAAVLLGLYLLVR